MSPSTFPRVRLIKLALISISVVFVAVALVWTTGQPAGASASKLVTGHSAGRPYVADKGGIGPQATTITVNSTSDVANGSDGLCTLREAITAANNNAASGGVAGECSPGSGSEADTIDLTSITGVISLSTALPNISSEISVVGPGANLLTIQRSTAGGTPSLRVFNITVASPAVVSFSKVKVSNGSSDTGGGISNTGTATVNVTECAVTNNFASSSPAKGGAIYNNSTGTVNLNNTTVSNNSATSGAGINNNGAGTVNLINSTISGNGGSFGGGINNDGGPVNITNCTITNNSGFGGGGILSNGTGTVRLRNTIVAGNTAGGSGPDVLGTFTTAGHNLIGKNDGAAASFPSGNPNANSDKVGTGASPINPLLGALQNNGGATSTHSLGSGSPALDAGDDCVTDTAHCSDANISQLTSDQRGRSFNRIVDGPDGDATATVDIGAYEMQTPLANLANTSTNEDTQILAVFDGGDTSTITSVTATSDNPSLVPNDSGHLSVAMNGTTGVITINPATNANGTANITVTVNRTGGGSDVKTFMLTVNPVNDAPSFTKGADQTVNEDSGAQTVNNWAMSISPGPVDETGQTVSFNITGNTNAGLFSTGPAVSSSGTLTYTPAANANGSATITFAAQDNGGTANGGSDTSGSQTFTITVSPVADSPSVTNATTTVDNQTTSGLVISRNAADGGEVTNFKITNIQNGTLFKNNGTTQINNNDFITFAEGNAGLKFTPGSNLASPGTLFSFQVQASLSSSDAGLGGATATASITVNCGSTIVTNSSDSGAGSLRAIINVACIGSAITFDMSAGHVTSPITLTSGKLLINKNLTISGPGANLLSVSGNNASTVFEVASGQTVTIADLTIANGRVTNPSTAGGVANAGTLTLADCALSGHVSTGFGAGAIYNSATMTISGCTISGNTAPSFGAGIQNAGNSATLNVNNSTISGNSGSSFGGGISNSNGIVNITNSTISGNTAGFGGGIYNTGTNPAPTTVNLRNTIVSDNKVFNAGNPPDISNNGNGTIAGDYNLIQTTNGYTISGSNNLNGDPKLEKDGSGNLVLKNNGGATQTLALLAGSPAIDAGSNTLANNAGLTTDQRGTGFTRIVDGPDADTTDTVDIGAFEVQVSLEDISDKTTNEDTQLQFTFNLGGSANITSVTASSSNTSLVPNNAANLLVSGSGSTRTLTVNPAANLSGTSTITVTVTGNSSQTMTDTFLLTVNPVNDAPSFVKGPDFTINEDAGDQIFLGWASGFSKGPPDESSQSFVGFTVTNNNNALFSVQPAITATLTTGTLNYTPAANAFGTATVTVTLKDNGGTANGGVDTSAPQTFTITVNPINDAPSFTKGANQTVNEDSGGQTVSNWATNISAGPNESGQTVSFTATNDNNPLFSVQPAVSATGTLTYTPAANANGSATVTLTLKDNGGTANGGVDTSPSQTFTITVNAVNDVPSFTKGASQTVNEDAGAQTVAGWATAISNGPADESGQTVSFTATNDNNALFSAQPAVSATGTLTYTPAANANGSASVSVTIKDNGGTANGGVDTSAAQTFTITVNAVNDAPSFTKGANQTVNEDAGAQTVANWVTNPSAGAANEAGQTVTLTVTNNNNALFSSQPAIATDGTLTYTPAANANGSATVTVTAKDDGGTANGGSDTSTQTFTINVNAVNDVPSFTKGADQAVNNNAGAQTVTNWATSISSGPANESGQTLTFQITGNTNPGLFTSGPAVSSTGTLTYTSSSSGGGTATITINLKDNGGTANGGVDTSASQTFVITVTPVGGFVNFASSTDNTTENSGSTTVNVVRTGNTSLAATVNYATNADAGVPCSTANGVASPKCDFTTALGTLNFAAGETSKPITILISQDSFVEGPEVITLTLSNATGGAALGTPSSMTVTIADDATEPPSNIIDDPNMFVRMHYHDFLNREGDQSGINFWTGQMSNCGSPDLLVCRVNVSGAFFLSIEFQQTGYLVERVYKTAYGDATATSQLGGSHQIFVPVVRATEFLTDTQRIGRGVVVLQPGWEQVLENNKQAYALEFVQTSRFVAALPTTMTPAQFVDRLNQNAGNVLSPSERTAAINAFGIAADTTNVNARAQVLRQIAEDQDLYNAEFSRAFVLAEFIGYLRRNPNDAPESTLDYTGYEFWLNKMSENGGDYIKAEMVKAFISSSEYRQRFGP